MAVRPACTVRQLWGDGRLFPGPSSRYGHPGLGAGGDDSFRSGKYGGDLVAYPASAGGSGGAAGDGAASVRPHPAGLHTPGESQPSTNSSAGHHLALIAPGGEDGTAAAVSVQRGGLWTGSSGQNASALPGPARRGLGGLAPLGKPRAEAVAGGDSAGSPLVRHPRHRHHLAFVAFALGQSHWHVAAGLEIYLCHGRAQP